MVKPGWAVARLVPVFGLLIVLGGGCAGTKSQVKEFSRMEVGSGPGEVLGQLLELQKKPVAQPPSVAREEHTGAAAAPETSRKHARSALSGTGSGNAGPVGRKETENEFRTSLARVFRPPVSPAPAARREVPASRGAAGGTASASGDASAATIGRAPAASRETALPAKISATALQRQAPGSAGPGNVRGRRAVTAAKQGGSWGPNYRIGPEDVLHVDVWGNDELTGDYTVRPDGRISMPLIQDVLAQGTTSAILAARIHEKLRAYIKAPNVSVIVKEINAPKFSILGYVTKPGTYPLRGDLSVLQALSQAGGFTPFASPKKIKIIRTVRGKQQSRRVNYYDLIAGRSGENYLLKPGDTIVVP